MNAAKVRLALALFGIAIFLATWRGYRKAQKDWHHDSRLQLHRKRALIAYAVGFVACVGGLLALVLPFRVAGGIGLAFAVIAVIAFAYGLLSFFVIGWIKGAEPPARY